LITPLVKVAIQDAAGNTVTTAQNPIAIGLGANPAGATLSFAPGTGYLVDGVASFGVSLDRIGSGYRLTAFAPGLAGATSDSFSIARISLESVSAGDLFSCGMAVGGSPYCWGQDVSEDHITRGIPVQFAPGLTFASVSAGSAYACAVTTAGAAYCWRFGIPVAVAGGLTFTEVSASLWHACGVASGGAAYCWRAQTWFDSGTAPTPVPGGLSFASVSDGGGGATCGVTISGAAYCWGGNYHGLLGNGDTLPRSAPEAVAGGLTFKSVSVGGGNACGVTTGGAAYCWGEDFNGELGNGSAGGYSTVPVAVAGGLTFAAVSAGGLHTCGLTTGGEAYCWGWNAEGQLGLGTSDQQAHGTPAAVAGGLTFAALSAGARHTCGVTTSGVAYCWGANDHAQLGSGGSAPYSSVPLKVAGQL
jgi:hypothetical protein